MVTVSPGLLLLSVIGASWIFNIALTILKPSPFPSVCLCFSSLTNLSNTLLKSFSSIPSPLSIISIWIIPFKLKELYICIGPILDGLDIKSDFI